MDFDKKDLPDNIDELKEIIQKSKQRILNLEQDYSTTQSELSASRAELEKKQQKNNLLHEQLRLLRLQLFGKRSEKLELPELFSQLSLFNEIEEDYASVEEPEPEYEPETEIKAHTRKRSGRKPLPAELPREEVIHDIPESEKMCGCGCQLERIGEETSEKLEMEKPRIYVKRHIRLKYACRNCEGSESTDKAVKVAPVPPQILPKSIASESLLAHIITGKFADSLPFYRQEKQFLRNDIKISRSTMSIWALKLFERCYPLDKLLFQATHSGPLIQMDETTLQVLNEEGKEPSSKSYMWVMRGGLSEKPVVYFRYYPTRSGSAAKELLNGYEGYVQSDGYAGYNFLDKNVKNPEEWRNITHIGCWAHARRYFFDVKKAAKNKKPGKADKVLRLIAELYKIENKAQNENLSTDEITELRQEKSKPIIEKIKAYLDDNIAKIPPETALGKAFGYAMRQWDLLIIFLNDGSIPIDNNRIENDIRPFVVGRKNWLFTKSTAGAKASAFFYSLIETAKNNNLEPFAYLKYVFEKIPLATTNEDYKALLPQNIDRELLK